jgi:hypothetical protein
MNLSTPASSSPPASPPRRIVARDQADELRQLRSGGDDGKRRVLQLAAFMFHPRRAFSSNHSRLTH